MSINIQILTSLGNLAKLDLDSQLAVIDSIQGVTVPFRQRMNRPFRIPYKIVPYTLLFHLGSLPGSEISYPRKCL